MVAGAALGLGIKAAETSSWLSADSVATISKWSKGIGDLFLKMLKMLIVPLIVTSLITGVTSMGNLRELRKVGKHAFIFYLSSSLVAIITGLLVVNIVRPGMGIDLGGLVDQGKATGKTLSTLGESQQGDVLDVLGAQIKKLIPSNPLAAAAGVSPDTKPGQPNMLALIFFSILFGIFINAIEHSPREDEDPGLATKLKEVIAGTAAVMMRMTLFVISLAPIGIFAFTLFSVVDAGLEIFSALAKYVLAVGLALAVHAFISLPIALRWLGGRSPLVFAKQMSEALLTAFSTASSNGTLPLTMKCAEERAQIDGEVTSFVLPLGATINMDGTALYEAVAVLFIAQGYGLDFSVAQQATVVITALLVSIGAAGIPHAGTVMMVVILNAVNLPTEALYAILAVDRVLDMARTTVNVWSDSIAAAIVSRVSKPSAPAIC